MFSVIFSEPIDSNTADYDSEEHDEDDEDDEECESSQSECSDSECDDNVHQNPALLSLHDESTLTATEISLEMDHSLDLAKDDVIKIDQVTQTDFKATFPEKEPPKVYYGPHRKFTRGEDTAEHLKELDMIQTPKVICSLDLLEKLFHGRCSEPDCILPLTVTTTTVGVTAVISWQCAKGHKGKFCSSHKIRGLYANNVQVASAILISGNNYNKISQLFNFSSLTFMNHTTFYRYQRKLFFPVITEWWIWMRRSIINELSEQPVVLAGDGQCDSPGKTAKYLSYYLMDITTNYIVH